MPIAELLAAVADPAEAYTLFIAQSFYARDGDPRHVAYSQVIAYKAVNGFPMLPHETDWVASAQVRALVRIFNRKGVLYFLEWHGARSLARIAPWREELTAYKGDSW